MRVVRLDNFKVMVSISSSRFSLFILYGSPTNNGDVKLSLYDVESNKIVESYIYDYNGNHDGHRRIIRTWFGSLITTGGTSAPNKHYTEIRNVKWKINYKISPFRPLKKEKT